MLAQSVESISVPLILTLSAVLFAGTAAIGIGAIVAQLKRAVQELDRLAKTVEDLRDRVIRLESRMEREQ